MTRIFKFFITDGFFVIFVGLVLDCLMGYSDSNEYFKVFTYFTK